MVLLHLRKFLFLIILFFSIYYIYRQRNNRTIKIMGIGDSITSSKVLEGSYRKFLYHNLISKGYNIKMVGSIEQKIKKYYDEETKEEFKYPDDNSGFSSYTICTYEGRKGLLEILKKDKILKLNPDIIILLIGTNNIMDNYDFDKTMKDFISLIDYIFDNISPNSTLFVATIPDMDPNKKFYKIFKNYRQSKDGKIKYNDNKVKKLVLKNIKKFNKGIKKIINEYKDKNYNIRLENLNYALKDIDNLFDDGVHPNNKGYKKMGDFWSNIIEKFLNETNLNKLI